MIGTVFFVIGLFLLAMYGRWYYKKHIKPLEDYVKEKKKGKRCYDDYISDVVMHQHSKPQNNYDMEDFE
jgi:hypothetical protein